MSQLKNLSKRIKNLNARGGAQWRIAIALVALSLVMAKSYAVLSFNQDLDKLNRFVQTSNSQSPAMKVFREGRDFIENGDWSRAAERFNYFIANYSKDRDLDAALYWLSFALKKQQKLREADQILSRLLEKFPTSRWADDARNLRVEIAGQLGDSSAINQTLEVVTDPETKLIALQSLFQGNPERAIALAAEILRPDSKASRDLKEAAVSMLGIHGGSRGVSLLVEIARSNADARLRKEALMSLGRSNFEADADSAAILALLKEAATRSTDDETSEAALFALSQARGERATQTLIEVARTAPSAETRGQAIHWLGQRGGESVVDELSRIYDSERSEDIKGRVLHAFSQMRSPRARAKLLEIARNPAGDADLRQTAIHWLGDSNDETVLDELMRLFETDPNKEIRGRILYAFSQMRNPRAYQKLLDVARNSSMDNDLRQTAIHWLSQKGSEEIVQELSKIYESDRNPEIRARILHAYTQTNNPRALEKLIAVARSESDADLRGTAIHWLGQRNAAEAVETLIQIYDAERREEIKSQIIFALSQSNRQKRALRKLMEIARTDTNADLRRTAIHWLGQSKDPEALKFLEEILK